MLFLSRIIVLTKKKKGEYKKSFFGVLKDTSESSGKSMVVTGWFLAERRDIQEHRGETAYRLGETTGSIL